MSTAAHAQAGRDRARQKRLRAARERRLRLDPDELARKKCIDAATVDVELAWEARAEGAASRGVRRGRGRGRAGCGSARSD